MLSVFSGENRLEAEKAVKRALGTDYEVFEGENLTVADLPSIFWELRCLALKSGRFY